MPQRSDRPSAARCPDPAVGSAGGWGGRGRGCFALLELLLQSHLVNTGIANGEHGICYTKSVHRDMPCYLGCDYLSLQCH